VNLVRCTPSDEILVAYITDMTMQKKVVTKKGHQILVSKSAPPSAEKIVATPMLLLQKGPDSRASLDRLIQKDDAHGTTE